MAQPYTDIPLQSWIDRRMPVAIRPYLRLMRLDRPIGTWLLLFPCWWGMALAPINPDLGPWQIASMALLFAIGAVVMRGAGCVVNDVLDRDFDHAVERTRSRPIPSGQVAVKEAMAFLIGLLLLGLAVLVQFNGLTIAVGAASLLLVGTYPLMKRITYWPQAFLGLTFNWGALVGWTAVTGSLGWPMLVLYAGGVAWTLAYDTIYAHQDKEDDVLIGVKSTALKFGAASPIWVAGFFALGLMLMAAAAWLAGLHWLVYPGMAAAGLHAAWQVRTWRMDDPANCLVRFKSNRDLAAIVLISLAAGSSLA